MKIENVSITSFSIGLISDKHNELYLLNSKHIFVLQKIHTLYYNKCW